MKIVKILWFLISASMLGVGIFFHLNPYEVATETPQQQEEEEDYTTFAFAGDEIILREGVTEEAARAITGVFTNSLSSNSWWWLPTNEPVTDISRLGNQYRLSIANYRVHLVNNNDTSENYEVTTEGETEIITTTEFGRAWSNVVGTEIPLTDGNPCNNMSYCNAYFIFNETAVQYETNTELTPVNVLGAIQYTEITKEDDSYSLSIRAVFIERNDDGTHTIYTDPSKTTILGSSNETRNEGESATAFHRRISAEFMNRANTFVYTFTNNNGNFLFSGFRVVPS